MRHVEIGDDHLRALCRESSGDGATDAIRRTGDDRDLIVQYAHDMLR